MRKCGKCCLLTGCTALLATVFVLTIAFGVAAYKIKHCVHPSQVDTKEYTFDPSSLDVLSLNIPSGSISVHTCPRAKNVTITVVTGAKTADRLKEFVLDVKETANSFTLSAKAPSFNLQTCQIMHVSVVIPESSKHALSFTAKADVGYINLKTKAYTFDNVVLNTNVGLIRARKVTANDISATTSFGGIIGCTWNATNSINVHADIGGTCLTKLTSKQATVFVDKGVMRTCTVDTAVLNTTLNYGCMKITNLKSQSLNSHLTYGRMWVSPSPKFSGTVVFSSPNNGHFDVTAARGLEVPSISIENLPGLQQKWVRVVDEQAKDGTGRLTLKSESGSVELHITNHDL